MKTTTQEQSLKLSSFGQLRQDKPSHTLSNKAASSYNPGIEDAFRMIVIQATTIEEFLN